jgi:hypothetical protein
MARGTPRPNAAIYYAIDAFDTSPPQLMGRHAIQPQPRYGWTCPHSGHCPAPAHTFQRGSCLKIGTADRTPLQERSEEEAVVGAGIGGLDRPLA